MHWSISGSATILQKFEAQSNDGIRIYCSYDIYIYICITFTLQTSIDRKSLFFAVNKYWLDEFHRVEAWNDN